MVIIEKSRLIRVGLSNTYTKVRIGKYPSHIFPLQSSPRQEIPFQGSSMTTGTTSCPETSVQNYCSNLRIITKRKGKPFTLRREREIANGFKLLGENIHRDLP